LGLVVDKMVLGQVCLPCVFMACLGTTFCLNFPARVRSRE